MLLILAPTATLVLERLIQSYSTARLFAVAHEVEMKVALDPEMNNSSTNRFKSCMPSNNREAI